MTIQKEAQVQLVSRILRRLSAFWLFGGPCVILGVWIALPWLPESIKTEMFHHPMGPVTPLVLAAGIAASIPGIVVHVLLFLQLMRLFGLWEKGIILETANVECFSKLGKFYLLSAVINILQESATSFALTLGLPRGHHSISIGFDTNQIQTFAIGLFLWLTAFVLEQGHRIKQEADLTV